MAGTKVQTSKFWKWPIFPDLARFSGETGSNPSTPPIVSLYFFPFFSPVNPFFVFRFLFFRCCQCLCLLFFAWVSSCVCVHVFGHSFFSCHDGNNQTHVCRPPMIKPSKKTWIWNIFLTRKSMKRNKWELMYMNISNGWSPATPFIKTESTNALCHFWNLDYGMEANHDCTIF